jgi:hypothetical protein
MLLVWALAYVVMYHIEHDLPLVVSPPVAENADEVKISRCDRDLRGRVGYYIASYGVLEKSGFVCACISDEDCFWVRLGGVR